MDKLVVGREAEGMRADRFLSENVEGFSREKLKNLFKENKVLIDDAPCKASRKVLCGEVLCFELPKIKVLKVEAEDIPLDIVYEDNDVVVIDKKQGMVVHPANGNYNKTMVNALMYHIKDLSDINGIIRPGIVHRIDKDTSGLIVVAKNNDSHIHLANQFKDHSITRRYKAVAHGIFKHEKGTIDAPLGRHKVKRKEMCVTGLNSKRAVTHFSVEKCYEKCSVLDLKLETGRTHQIRVHLKYINHPVVGDKVYGYNTKLDMLFEGQLLHAYKLGFIHPRTNKYIEFESEIPKYFNKALKQSE